MGHYTGGLEAGVAQEDANLAAVLHCNRAAAHHACSRFLDALADCYCAAALDASYPRVYHRRADAYWALGAYEAAAQVGMGLGEGAGSKGWQLVSHIWLRLRGTKETCSLINLPHLGRLHPLTHPPSRTWPTWCS